MQMNKLGVPPLLLLERAPPPGQTDLQAKPKDAGTDDGGEALVCAACRHPITTTAARFEAFGGHLHDRMNPSGYVFRLGLYSRAPGVRSASGPSSDFTWFPGYRWEIVVCRGCFEHLGWRFSGLDVFFALLPEKLVLATEE